MGRNGMKWVDILGYNNPQKKELPNPKIRQLFVVVIGVVNYLTSSKSTSSG